MKNKTEIESSAIKKAIEEINDMNLYLAIKHELKTTKYLLVTTIIVLVITMGVCIYSMI